MSIADYRVQDALARGLGTIEFTMGLMRLAAVIESELHEGQAEKLDFLGAVPGLQEWIGTRKAKQLFEYAHRLVLQKFESSIDVNKNWMLTDKTGLVMKRVNELVGRIPQHHAKQIAALITANGNSFDGKAFFANDHSWGNSGTIDNLLAPSASDAADPTLIETADAVVDAIEQIRTFNDDQGEAINESASDFMIVVPSGTNHAAMLRRVLAADATTITDGVGEIPNPVRAYEVNIELISSNYVTIANGFDLYRADAEAAPFVIGENPALRDQTMKGDGSDYEHDTGHRQYGIEVVSGYTYGRFTDAVRSVFA